MRATSTLAHPPTHRLSLTETFMFLTWSDMTKKHDCIKKFHIKVPSWPSWPSSVLSWSSKKCTGIFTGLGWFHPPRMHKCHIKPAHFASAIVASATHSPDIDKLWQVPDPTTPENLENCPCWYNIWARNRSYEEPGRPHRPQIRQLIDWCYGPNLCCKPYN